MDLMRSEPMQLVQLIIPIESAHLAVSYLGDLGLIQFKDVRDSYFSVVSFALIDLIAVFSCNVMCIGLWFSWIGNMELVICEDFSLLICIVRRSCKLRIHVLVDCDDSFRLSN